MEPTKLILPPPPTEIPPNVVPIRIEPAKRSFSNPSVITTRPGSNGKRVPLLTNHFKVTVLDAIGDFYHYDVIMFYEDGLDVTRKNAKVAVIEKLSEMYKSELDGKAFVYDGDRSLFTQGPLPQKYFEFSVILNPISTKGTNGNDHKRQRLASRSNIFKVHMKFASRVSMKSLNDAKCGGNLWECSSSLRVLNTILQQRASQRGYLVVRQSFFQNETSYFMDLGGGILACRGLFSSFRALQGGLYLNNDVSMTTIIQPGSVVDFLVKNQNVKNPFKINWNEAGRTLKNLRIKVKHLDYEFKITGLSEKSCKEEKFSLKLGERSEGIQSIVTTVYDYFVSARRIELSFSADLPCINVGKPRRPTFFPVELCFLVPLQRNKKELTVHQKSTMIVKCREKPEELMRVLDNDVKRIKLEDEPFFQSCGVSINGSFVQVEGRVLTAPRLRTGNGEQIIPRNGWWNIKDTKLVEPKRLENWAIVKFSTCDVSKMCEALAKVSSAKGMVINPPSFIFEENPKHRKKPPRVRVEMMFEQIRSKFREKLPQFILCLLADKKFSDLYGPWKRKTIIDFGIIDQCISSKKIDELYLMNLLLKINVKLGGFNHVLHSEITRTIPLVVGSREWPRISSYRASLRTLPPKTHTIDSLFKPTSQNEDAGIIRELLMEFYASSGQKKPAQIVIFRNGLSTSEFDQVLKVEMDQILKACNFLEENWCPKFTVIVSQRRHHTKFFDAKTGGNVTPGTIVDSKVCDLEFDNFYMCAHASRVGTLRPTHYYVLLNEIGFSSDDLQQLIHSLSYVFQRSNNAISEVAPVRYARLAAAKMSQLIRPEEMPSAQTLPKVHKNLSSSMFFV